jgi:hypothetical protein
MPAQTPEKQAKSAGFPRKALDLAKKKPFDSGGVL